MSAKSKPLTPERSTRHLFGYRLRELRQRAGMSLEALARVVNSSSSQVQRIETAEGTIPPDLPAKFDIALGADGVFSLLYLIARHEVHPDKYRRMMELEARARTIGEYAGQVVPGLVQTEDYARALFWVSNPQATSAWIEEKVDARMGRQELLHADPAPYLSILLDEAVLRRPVGGPEVMRRQLAALLPLADSPNSVVQVIPNDHGEHPFLGGSLKLLEFADGPSAAYEEGFRTGTLVEEAESVGSLRRAFDLMRSYALSPTLSSAMIISAMEALPHEYQPRPGLGGVAQEQLQQRRRGQLHRDGPRVHHWRRARA